MDKERIDIYDLLLEVLGYHSGSGSEYSSEIRGRFDEVTELASELGLSLPEMELDLVLWNDDVNDMIHVVLAMYEVCRLDNEDSMAVMLKAHEEGKAVAGTGSFEYIERMASALRQRNLTVSIEFHENNT